MTTKHPFQRGTALTTIGIIAMVGIWGMTSAGSADAASVLNGPINLGTSATYGALAGTTLTNTGATNITGDIGVSPGSSITGMGSAPGSNTGATNDNNAAALMAKNDLTTAYNNAAGLTPTTSGLGELSGLSLVPGVYSGGALALSNNGTLTLAGTSANSIWVFQAASTLTIGSATHIVFSGGASACNVFWQVGSSATIGTSAQFAGTVLASASITAQTGATISGRLLASTAAVTLDTNTITVPNGCVAGGTPTSTPSPQITSGAPTAATAGTPYSFAVTASGSPSPTFTLSAGALPAGLVLDSATGMITGTPTTHGTATFTITATNGTAQDVGAVYSLVTDAQVLALTGVNPMPGLELGGALLFIGGILFAVRRRITRGAQS
jgi:hypothetical protein